MIKLHDIYNSILLKEEHLGYANGIGINKFKEYGVYKNPTTISNMAPFLRGISDKDGNLYIIDDGKNTIHSTLYKFLVLEGHMKSYAGDWFRVKLTDLIPWQRNSNKNELVIGESVNDDEVTDVIKKSCSPMIKRLKQKNPKIKFILKSINLIETN